jgi:hypothetical protein
MKHDEQRLEQIKTVPITAKKIMASPRFAQGVADMRAGRGFPADYDAWAETDKAWAYERGRAWGRLVPRNVVFKNGNPTAEAIAWFLKFAEHIL